MPCFHPLSAWRLPSGVVTLREPREDGPRDFLRLPCGGCIGCRKSRAREWALRCTLELAEHSTACWSTLTYEDRYKPPSLRRDHLQGWLKRLRRRLGAARVKFFASGEYGERTFRPHYHAILFGVPVESSVPQASWPFGYVRVDPLTPAAISYVAGYCSKKLGWQDFDREERVDYETGEVYTYEPPFVQMSRGGRTGAGIASAARRFASSWRSHAVLSGNRMPVPRYLHKAWVDTATDDQLIKLKEERDALPRRDVSRRALAAGEAAAVSLHEISSLKRSKL